MKQGSINKIEIDRVHFSYPKGHSDTVVIADFSLAIQNREFVTIVGPSGCGKSTLLNIVAGLFPPTSGRVLVDGVPISGPSSDRTMVFQDDAVFPWFTVKQNVEYGPRIAGMEKEQREEAVQKNLGLVGLLDSQDKYPRELSGGMRKRVDVARAIATAPDILLMDEPFAALDVMTKEKLQDEFLDIWDELKMTVLFVTHDLEEALYMSDRVLIMSISPGKIVEVVVSPFGRPRNLDLKTEDKFQALRRKLAHVIQNL